MKKFCLNCIYESLDHTVIELDSGEKLFFENDKLNYVYYIVDGYVKISKLHLNGDEKVFDILGKDEYIALLAVLQGSNQYIANAETLTNVTLRKIKKNDVLQAYQSNTMFQQNCMNCVVTRSQAFHRQLFNVSNNSAEEKIFSTLEFLANKFGEIKQDKVTLKLPFSKSILASIIGIRRETLSRKISEMVDDGLLEVEKNIYKFNRL